jgi:simple sugar transport system permease protein
VSADGGRGDGDGPVEDTDAGTSWPDRLREYAVSMAGASAGERLFIALAAIVLSMLVGTVIVVASGLVATCRTPVLTVADLTLCYDPVAVYDRLFFGALGDPLSEGWSPLNAQFAVTLRETTILVFTGLSVALAFRAGIFNIGTQGQLVVGALVCALTVLWAAPALSGVAGTVVLIPLGLLAGAVGGGFYGAIPGVLKAYAEANEVITTIMLNFVAVLVVRYLVSDHFQDPGSQAIQTASLPEYAQFPSLFFDPRLDFSLVALAFALAVVGGVYYLLSHTSYGFDLRTAGLQPAAAEYGGVDSARTVVTSLTLSGALGGVGGAVYVLMVLGKFQRGVPSYGFDGITVSILAGNNPIGAVFAAFLFGVLQSGSSVVDFATDVPPQLVGVLRGLIILFVAMPEFFRLVGRRITPEGGEPTAAPGGAADD